MWIGRVVKIISPGQRRVRGGQHGKFVAIKDTVAGLVFTIAPRDELSVFALQLFDFYLKDGFRHNVLMV